jgi:hypothetical protein
MPSLITTTNGQEQDEVPYIIELFYIKLLSNQKRALVTGTGTSSFPVMFNTKHMYTSIQSRKNPNSQIISTEGKKQIMRTCEVEAWCVLTTSNASSGFLL